MSSESAQAMAQRFLWSFRETKLLMFDLVDFIRRKPVYCPPLPTPHPPRKKLCSAEFIKGCLRGRFLKSGRRGNLMKKDLEIFSFSRLSKA